jgi:hypothetical protein
MHKGDSDDDDDNDDSNKCIGTDEYSPAQKCTFE